MTSHLEMFDRVVRFVESKGFEATFDRGRPLAERTVRSAHQRLPIPLPTALVELYREVGDGFSLSWTDGKPVPPTPAQKKLAARIDKLAGVPFEFPVLDDGKVFANLDFPPLSKLVASHLDRARWGVEYDDQQKFSHVRDRALAGQIARRMRGWFGFHDEGNGDRFCLDTASPTTVVVFDQHDWFDGGTGTNGAPLGPTLSALLSDWSRVCFQFPRSLHWPSVLTEAGVNWESDEFDRRFRMTH